MQVSFIIHNFLVFSLVMQSIGKVVRVNTNDLSRKKRYVAFPEGSSVTVSCVLEIRKK